MRVAIIGRAEGLYDSVEILRSNGHEIACVIAAKEAPEYIRTLNDFKSLAMKLHVPFLHSLDPLDLKEVLLASRAQIGVSMNYPAIVSQDVIDCLPFGILNAHGGDLPRYRGNACQAWAILNGESQIGLCVHKMVGGKVDSGDIVARDYFKIDINTKITEVQEWIYQSVPHLMRQAIDLLSMDVNYVLEIQSTDSSEVLRCYPRIPDDGKIDWNRTSREIHLLVNACNRPYRGAFCDLEGETITLWDTQIIEDDEHYLAIPGQVLKIGPDFVDVACGQGTIRIRLCEVGSQIASSPKFVTSLRRRFT